MGAATEDSGNLPQKTRPQADVPSGPMWPGSAGPEAPPGGGAAGASGGFLDLHPRPQFHHRVVLQPEELDHAAGKLSDEDFALLDAELRKEAIEILDSEPV